VSAAAKFASTELRDAHDLIVQLQRELERARGVIEEQREVVQRATRMLQQRRGA